MDIAATILLTVFVGLVVMLILYRPRNCCEPPCLRGWMPWIGAAFEFGKAPLDFIEEARLKCGPVFTIYVLGKRYTFVSGEEGLQAFCTSKDADFEQAVQQSVKHAVSVPEEIFYKNRSRLYIMLKERLSLSNLHQFPEKFCQELQKQMEDLGPESTEELRDFIRRIMFPASVNILFGKNIFLATKNHIKEFEEHFQNFDEGFEYATQLPECFMKKWSHSKKWLLRSFEKVVLHSSDGDSKTLLQYVLDTLQGKHFSANYGLLLLWASQANVIPVSLH
uniref:Cytochrome P450 family 39 subfamily A member 1 n=1 Tax=Salvator merianae TaxID=96440 RepID=A0A8D0BGY4_SALMN